MTHSDSAGKGSGLTPAPNSGPPAKPAARIRCGICGKRFDFGSSPFRPFCSSVCRQIDLGNWLGEEYGLPWEAADAAERIPETEESWPE